ncbi:putative DMT superfamily transporter inner membrane protein [Caballeronia calidae]|uniref:DMT superfamily transporter inner membrane protein n=1 Tax=Caballeronia calidae TaxID=1777139 RepID=A0A158E610_9BURK|nr:DMT family transporter [Caballeronia calidae]SAL01367.1 putative DMT superfamily transporter inner membrane protein [Caballeronia calidae]
MKLAFILLGLLGGANLVYMKWATEVISPMQVAFLRVLFGFLPLVFAAWRQGAITRAQVRLLPHFLMMAAGATAFYFVAIIKGTSMVPLGIAGVLGGSIALFTALFSVVFLRSEKLTGVMAIGVVLGFLGIVLISRPWETGEGAISFTGVLWLLASSMILGLSYIYVRLFLSPANLPPLALATWQMGLALLILFFCTDFTGISHLLSSLRATIGVVVGLGILGTGAAFLLYYLLLQRMGAVASSSANYLAPAVALLLGWFMGDRFGLVEVVAITLIFASTALLQTQQRRAASTEEPPIAFVLPTLADESKE